jgi:hypothetical protein
MALLPVLRFPLQTADVESLSGHKGCRAVGGISWEDSEAIGAPIVSLSRISSLSIAVLRRNKSWMVRSRPWLLLSSASSHSSRSMCSLVRVRIALWASRSLALLRASCSGVRVETLLVSEQRYISMVMIGCPMLFAVILFNIM